MTHTTIFTDGSALLNPGRGGWGFSAWLDGREVHHDCGGVRKSTNNAMELTALVRALEWLKDNPVHGHVEIVSDSKYLVDGTNAWRLKWRRNGWVTAGKKSGPVKNCQLWQAIDALVDELDVTVKWERGHNGNAGNERAHELADRGRTSGNKSNSDVHSIYTTQIGNHCRNAESNVVPLKPADNTGVSRQLSAKPGQGLFATLELHDNTNTRLQAAELLLRHGDISEAVFKAVVDRCHGSNGNGGGLLQLQPNGASTLAAALVRQRFVAGSGAADDR